VRRNPSPLQQNIILKINWGEFKGKIKKEDLEIG
jgi:hypothetical protein